jgi:hypothetical protein
VVVAGQRERHQQRLAVGAGHGRRHLPTLGVAGERRPVGLGLGPVGAAQPRLAGVDGHRDEPFGAGERRLGALDGHGRLRAAGQRGQRVVVN